VVVNGYKRDAERGELWLRVVDSLRPHDDLLGEGNFKMITRPETPDKEFSEYWVKARRLLEMYPGRKTRLYAHADHPLGHFFYAIPDQPVKDDSELVHKIGTGLGATAGPGKDKPATPARPARPRTGVPRLPYALKGSVLVSAETVTALYHQTERGLGRLLPARRQRPLPLRSAPRPERGSKVLAMSDGELVAARIGVGPGEHAWGDTGIHPAAASLPGRQEDLLLYLHLQREVLHPDKTDAPWLRRLLIDAMQDKGAPKKPKWRVQEPQAHLEGRRPGKVLAHQRAADRSAGRRRLRRGRRAGRRLQAVRQS